MTLTPEARARLKNDLAMRLKIECPDHDPRFVNVQVNADDLRQALADLDHATHTIERIHKAQDIQTAQLIATKWLTENGK